VLTVVDTTTRAVGGSIPIDDGPPQYLAFSLDGTRAYVSVFSEQSNAQNHSVNRVVVVDTRRGRIVASIPVGTRPSALAVTPGRHGVGGMRWGSRLRQINVPTPCRHPPGGA
jgi:DNA-binding beta-propeller fold protein YncE